MATYSATDKFLHKFYLSNYGISKATLEIEEILHGQKAKQLDIEQFVFITGLARSGTTAVMRKIFSSGVYASLQYSNMPFLLSPNLWKHQSKIKSHERAHNDGIIIDGNSPEEFDEYFWKVFMNDSYIKEEGLELHDINDKILKKYMTYVSLVCLAKGKNRYISKNNNNILRLSSLQKIPNHKIIILVREPISHASSLMKLHKKFSKSQSDDSFSLNYFNYLGHHEFGLNHKPFLLTKSFDKNRQLFDKNSLNYWLSVWLNYYSYIVDNNNNDYLLIRFEDLTQNPNEIYEHLAEQIGIAPLAIKQNKFTPPEYRPSEYDAKLLDKCMKTYHVLAESSNSIKV